MPPAYVSPGGATDCDARASVLKRTVGSAETSVGSARRSVGGTSLSVSGFAMLNFRNVFVACSWSVTRISRPYTAGLPSGERAATVATHAASKVRFTMSSPSGCVKTNATFGASSSSHRERNAEPPLVVHSQPSTPSSRGTTFVPAIRRRIGKRPSLGSARAAPGSAAATAIAPRRRDKGFAQHAAVVQLHAGRSDLEEVDRAPALPALAACLELEQVLVAGRGCGFGLGGSDGLRRRCAGRVGHVGTYIGMEAPRVEPPSARRRLRGRDHALARLVRALVEEDDL